VSALATLRVSLTLAVITRLAAQAPDTSLAWKLKNDDTGLVLGIRSCSEIVQQPDDAGAGELWHFMPADEGRWKLVNLAVGALLAIADGSATGGAVIPAPDTGAPDRLWIAADAKNGSIQLRHVNSGLVLSAAAAGAVILAPDDASARQRWTLIATGPAYPDPAPVSGDIRVHDPSMTRTAAGTYYLFGTHRGVLISSSPDRVHFTSAGQAFTAPPAWVSAYNPRGDLWAPDVSRHHGRYLLYYTASRFGTQNSAIGLATSRDASPGSWSDRGVLIASQPGSPYNAIDPALAVDRSGKWWLSFGSFWNGINLIAIDPATGKQLAGDSAVHRLAHRPASPAIEGACIYPHGPWYYLFASFDRCCRGAASTYHIVVGRAANITGPYRDRCGVDMQIGGGTILLSSHGRYAGPGGQSVFHDTGGDYLIYHYYDAAQGGRPTLGINSIGWDAAGWPFLCGAAGCPRSGAKVR